MFKTFPEFSKLTLADRAEYEAFTGDLPPLSDLAFVSLMTIWSSLDNTQISVLNNNLVISYWMPGDEWRSGLSLIGTNRIDESFCTIFDHLKGSGGEARLVNIPKAVLDHIRYPEIFELDYRSGDEDYIVSFKYHASLPDLPFYKRARIKRFVRNSGNVEVKSVDLNLAKNRQMLLDYASRWPKKGLNNIGKFEEEAMQFSVQHAPALGLKNICVFEDGELILFDLYHVFPQQNYILIAHSRLDYSIPGIFDYMTYRLGQWWLDHGIEYANIHGDMGILKLRAFKIALRPVEFYRKYTVKPAR